MEFVKILHAAAGLFIGIIGLLQILLPKGGSRHRTLGQIYFWSWPLLIATGAMLGYLLVTLFGVMGLYMALTGFRLARKKRIRKKKLDTAIILMGILASLSSLIYGMAMIFEGRQFGIVAILFGVLFLTFTIFDFLDFFKEKRVRKHSGQKKHWYFQHIIRMYSSYIAALTAFCAIQNLFEKELMNWFIPGIIGSGLIATSVRYFRKKLEKKNVLKTL